MRALVVLGLIGTSGGGASANELAEHPAPFAARDLNPFIEIHGLPPFQAAELTPSRRTQLRVSLDLANNSKLGDSANESITLDGETYRLALSARHGISDRLEAGIEIPLVFHTSGLFDEFIEGWHRFFGMPNGDRTEMPINALDFSHRYQGQESIAVRTDQLGLGDVRLFAATTLYRAEDGGRELSLHGSLKLPTGASGRLLGSGGTSLALSVNGVERSLVAHGITGFGRLGVLALGDGGVLATQQRHAVVFGGLGVSWRAGGWIDLKAQVDAHGPFYRSELLQLDSNSIQLTVGGTLYFGAATSLDLAVGENLFRDTIPDVLVNLTLSHRL